MKKKKTQQMPNFAKTFVGATELLDTTIISIMISARHFLTALIHALSSSSASNSTLFFLGLSRQPHSQFFQES